jgi:hypothetical protein
MILHFQFEVVWKVMMKKIKDQNFQIVFSAKGKATKLPWGAISSREKGTIFPWGEGEYVSL